MQIAILLHEGEQPARTPRYLLWGLRDVWQEKGLSVETFTGPDDAVLDADVLFAHVDLTALPDSYSEFLARHPQVVNGGAVDVSKQVVSENLVGIGEDWKGPVIVKTNRNAAGSPERRLLERNLLARARRRLSRIFSRNSALPPVVYEVFPTLADVPKEVFGDEHLVVERFLPEVDEDGLYCLRTYFFLGDRGRTYLAKSPDPVVKSSNIVQREEIDPSDELLIERHRLGLDYGKLDFVIHDGSVVLIDANKTPSTTHYPPKPNGRRRNEYLAPGINAWL